MSRVFEGHDSYEVVYSSFGLHRLKAKTCRGRSLMAELPEKPCLYCSIVINNRRKIISSL